MAVEIDPDMSVITVCQRGQPNEHVDLHVKWELVSGNNPDPDNPFGLLHTWRCAECGATKTEQSYYCAFEGSKPRVTRGE